MPNNELTPSAYVYSRRQLFRADPHPLSLQIINSHRPFNSRLGLQYASFRILGLMTKYPVQPLRGIAHDASIFVRPTLFYVEFNLITIRPERVYEIPHRAQVHDAVFGSHHRVDRRLGYIRGIDYPPPAWQP